MDDIILFKRHEPQLAMREARPESRLKALSATLDFFLGTVGDKRAWDTLDDKQRKGVLRIWVEEINELLPLVPPSDRFRDAFMGAVEMVRATAASFFDVAPVDVRSIDELSALVLKKCQPTMAEHDAAFRRHVTQDVRKRGQKRAGL